MLRAINNGALSFTRMLFTRSVDETNMSITRTVLYAKNVVLANCRTSELSMKNCHLVSNFLNSLYDVYLLKFQSSISRKLEHLELN